jgi:hypothetical protein
MWGLNGQPIYLTDNRLLSWDEAASLPEKMTLSAGEDEEEKARFPIVRKLFPDTLIFCAQIVSCTLLITNYIPSKFMLLKKVMKMNSVKTFGVSVPKYVHLYIHGIQKLLSRVMCSREVFLIGF